IVTSVSNLKYLLENANDAPMSEEENAALGEAKGFVKKFEDAMEDDFNTADAISVIFELVKFANTNTAQNSSRAFIGALKEEILMLCDICGLCVEKETEILDEEIEKLIQERQEARKAKNFARADEIRNILQEQGIILEDTREGVKWKRA
ncbi:MAG: cysteine--tRNA ligase, partial [Lachnospiraceae bacterium]|nr:cysteine--tRNA ligase [Lachnospiraceae bacterium]